MGVKPKVAKKLSRIRFPKMFSYGGYVPIFQKMFRWGVCLKKYVQMGATFGKKCLDGGYVLEKIYSDGGYVLEKMFRWGVRLKKYLVFHLVFPFTDHLY